MAALNYGSYTQLPMGRLAVQNSWSAARSDHTPSYPPQTLGGTVVSGH